MGAANTVHVIGSTVAMAVLAAVVLPILLAIWAWRVWRRLELKAVYGNDEKARRKDEWRNS